jgi:hypothetical protein
MKRTYLLFAFTAACSPGEDIIPVDAGPPPVPWGVPISGGTMIVSHDNTTAIVADPDRDDIAFANLVSGAVVVTPLGDGVEPGRLVEDSAGRVHVALRRGGALVSLDARGNVLERRAVCPEPRGVAYDPVADVVHVACTTGELVTFPAAGGPATRQLVLDRDLRDVIVTPTGLLVSRFRTAQLLELDAAGNVVATVSPPAVQRNGADGNPVPAVAETAWRTIALPDGTVLMSHQRQIEETLMPPAGGGGAVAAPDDRTGICVDPPVEPALTAMAPGSAMQTVESIAAGALPVDVAVSPDGTQIAVVVAGAQVVGVAPTTAVMTGQDGPPCEIEGTSATGFPPLTSAIANVADAYGVPTSVGFDAANDLIVFYPEAPAVAVYPARSQGPGIPAYSMYTTWIVLPGATGNLIPRQGFELQTPLGLACESCHPEGRDDGRTWDFAGLGPRRTQNTAGYIMERAPYDWDGDLPSMPALITAVFTNRMSGNAVGAVDAQAVGAWLERVPAPSPPAVVDAASVARGQALFESPVVGCTTCHSGALLTNNAIVDVGTGGQFKVPSLLGVGARPPYLHDGCAPTLADRFGACGGGDQHGHTSQLAAQDIADLVAFLETL